MTEYLLIKISYLTFFWSKVGNSDTFKLIFENNKINLCIWIHMVTRMVNSLHL